MHNRFRRLCLPLFTVAAATTLTVFAFSDRVLAQQSPTTEPWKSPVSSPSLSTARSAWLQSYSPYQALPNSYLEYESRYLAWGEENPELSPEQVVLEVNIGLDRDFYEDPDVVSNPDSTTVLVNKYNALPEDYVPQLEALGSRYGSGSLQPEAAAAFRAMADAAREDGISLRSVSAYRSYTRQENLYSRYLSYDSQASVDSYSARPGFSEHQTALALDINTASLSAHFENTPAYAWLTEHCAQYGFILRYPQGKEDITGYRFEPWHYRYVGAEIAQICMSQDLTYEEYIALQPVSKKFAEAGPVEGLPFI